MKRVWRAIYGISSTIVLAGLGGVAYCVDTDRSLGAIGCLALFIVGVIAFRMAWEIDVLQRRRMTLAAQERGFEAERGVFERDTDRARRDMDEQERAMRAALEAESAKLRRELAAEQDKMETDFANRKARMQRRAFALGFAAGKNGVIPDQRPADVIVLPVGDNRPTIMGTGTTNL